MIRYLLSLITVLAICSCTEEKETLELNAGPTVIDYQDYASVIAKGAAWNSGQPIVRGEGPLGYSLMSVNHEDTIFEEHAFIMENNGVVSLAEANLMPTGNYTIAVEVSNAFGTLKNSEAIDLFVTETLAPTITLNTPLGNNEVNLLVNPAGEPVDELGVIMEGLLPGVSLTFTDMRITEVLMSPSGLFLFDRESNHLETGSDENGVVQMVGPFSPGTYNLSFYGTKSLPEPVVLKVNVEKLNLPYEKNIFSLDLASEDKIGPRNNEPETEIAGMQTHLIYGELKPNKAFWNVQNDKNHPVDEYDLTMIARWLPFNANTGFETATANKSQSIMIMQQAIEVNNALEIRMDASFLANKAAELSSGLLRCDVLVCSEEQYQAMLAMSSQEEKKAAVNAWQKVASSFGTAPSAGTDANTGYGYFEFNETINKADLPESASDQLRFLFHMVADKDGGNPGYLAPQTFNVEGTFLDKN